MGQRTRLEKLNWMIPSFAAFVMYTKEDFWTMTSFAWIYSSKLKPVVSNPQANENYEDHFDIYGQCYLLQLYTICNFVSL